MSATEQPAEADPVLDALGRASALLDVDRAEEAESLLRRALADEPDHPFLSTELARVLLVQGRPGDAREHAERAVASAPGFAYAHAIRALALSGDERRFEAVDAAREAVALDPEDPYVHRTLARTALRAAWYDDALAAAETAIGIEPEDPDAHGVLGGVLLAMQRPRQAEVAFREALRLDPHDATALNALGVAVQAQGDRGAEARALFEQAARARPADPLPRANLAAEARSWVNGRWAWALGILCTVRAVGGLVLGEYDVALSWGVVAAVVFLLLGERARRRTAELSPATQRLLAEERWWQRTQITLWRPWFWFVPAPFWLVAAALGALWAADDAFLGRDPTAASPAILGACLVVGAGAGWRTWRQHGASWWARRRRPGA